MGRSLQRIEGGVSFSIHGSALASTNLPKLKEAFSAMVTEVVSPGEFYIQLADLQKARLLLQLSSDMDAYYNSSAPQSFHCTVNTLCAAKFSQSGEWFRAYVEEVNPDGTAKVFYVDYGNRETLPASSIQSLKPEFGKLPHYALHCSLAHVRSTAAAWTNEATNFFKTRVPLNTPTTTRIFYKGHGSLVVDFYIPDGNNPVSQALVCEGHATKFKGDTGKIREPTEGYKNVRAGEQNPKPIIRTLAAPIQEPKTVILKAAIASASLPAPKNEFDAVVTEITDPGCFYVQTGIEMARSLGQLSVDMNSHYGTVGYPSFQPVEHQLCAAPFGSSSDWFRAFVEHVNPNETAHVYYVDFGNAADAPISQLRPLEEKFSAVPYCALRCSLAYVVPKDSNKWSEEAIAFMKSSVPLEKAIKMKLVSKREDIIIVNIRDPQIGEDSIPNMLVKKGLVENISSMHKESDRSIKPGNNSLTEGRGTSNSGQELGEARSPGQGGTSNTGQEQGEARSPGQGGTSNTGQEQGEACSPGQRGTSNTGQEQEEALSPGQRGTDTELVMPTAPHAAGYSGSDTSSTTREDSSLPTLEEPTADGVAEPPAQLMVSAVESAIASARLPGLEEPFSVVVTDITHPGNFSIQIADMEMAQQLATLIGNMDAHYATTSYPPFNAYPHQFCAAQFSLNNKWYRGYIDSCPGNGLVQVYFPDYGNSEVVDVSRVHPLEQQFMVLPFSALRCSLAMPSPLNHEWSVEIIQLFMTSVPLYQVITASVLRREKDCLFVDILDPEKGSIIQVLQGQVHAITQDNMQQTQEQGRQQNITHVGAPEGVPVEIPYQQNVPMNQDISQHNEEPAAQSLPIQSNMEPGMVQPAPYQQNMEPDMAQPTPYQPNMEPGMMQPAPYQPNMEHGMMQPDPYQPNMEPGMMQPAPYQPVHLDSLPQVVIPQEEYFSLLVSDIQPTGLLSFQVITEANVRGLLNLSVDLNNHCTSVDHQEYHPHVGELCCAMFNEDNSWYRAIVDEVLPSNQCRVTFVDFGNQDVAAPKDIRRIPEMCLQLARQSRICSLTGLMPNEGSLFEEQVMGLLNERVLNKQLLGRIVTSTDASLTMELFDATDSHPGININQEIWHLTQPVVVKRPAVVFPQENTFEAVVTEVINPGEIWVQRNDHQSAAALGSLMDSIHVYCEGSAAPLAAPPAPGDFCFAKFSIDSKWYRVKILKVNEDNTVIVLYADYGNSEVIPRDRLREALPQYMELPVQALRCFLVGVAAGQQGWSADAVDWIQQIITRQLRLKVVERQDEMIGVELEDHGVEGGPVNIGEYLVDFGYATKN